MAKNTVSTQKIKKYKNKNKKKKKKSEKEQKRCEVIIEEAITDFLKVTYFDLHKDALTTTIFSRFCDYGDIIRCQQQRLSPDPPDGSK